MQSSEAVKRRMIFPDDVALGDLHFVQSEQPFLFESKLKKDAAARGPVEAPDGSDVVFIPGPELGDRLSRVPPELHESIDGIVLQRLTNKARIASLERFANLSRLGIAFARLTPERVKLIHRNSLKELILYNTTESLDEIASALELEELRSLVISGKELPESFNQCIKRLQSLEHLALTDCSLEKLSLKSLSGLRSLRLHKSSLTKDLIDSLEACTEMELLRLTTSQVDSSFLKRIIVKCPNLTCLDLRNTRVSDEALKHLAGLERLRSLNLSGCPVTGEGLKELDNLEKLESLNLDCLSLTDRSIDAISLLPGLQSITLYGTPLRDEQLARLKQNDKLEVAWGEASNTLPAGVGIGSPSCRPDNSQETQIQQSISFPGFLYDYLWQPFLAIKKETGKWPELSADDTEAFNAAFQMPPFAEKIKQLKPVIEAWAAATRTDNSQAIEEMVEQIGDQEMSDSLSALSSLAQIAASTPMSIAEGPIHLSYAWALKLAVRLWQLDVSANSFERLMESFVKHVYGGSGNIKDFAVAVPKLVEGDINEDIFQDEMLVLFHILKEEANSEKKRNMHADAAELLDLADQLLLALVSRMAASGGKHERFGEVCTLVSTHLIDKDKPAFLAYLFHFCVIKYICGLTHEAEYFCDACFKYLETSESSGILKNTIRIKTNALLSEIEHDRHNKSRAQQLAKEALEDMHILRKVADTGSNTERDDCLICEAMVTLAWSLILCDELSEAEALLMRSEAILEKIEEKGNVWLQFCRMNIAEVTRLRGHPEEALKTMKSVSETLEKMIDKWDSPVWSFIYLLRARIERDLKSWQDCYQSYDKAVSYRQICSGNHASTLNILREYQAVLHENSHDKEEDIAARIQEMEASL